MLQEKGEELTAEEEMGLAGASADDTESEYMRAITEDGLVTGSCSSSIIVLETSSNLQNDLILTL